MNYDAILILAAGLFSLLAGVVLLAFKKSSFNVDKKAPKGRAKTFRDK